MNLLEAFQNELDHFPNFNYPKDNIETILSNDENSVNYINKIIAGEKIKISSNHLGLAKGRARHSTISLFLGLSLKKFDNLFPNLSSIFNDNNEFYIKNVIEPYINYWLWTLTAVYHDYGYFLHSIKTIKNADMISIKPLFFENNDKYVYINDFERRYPKIFKNSQNDILKYFKYSFAYHKNHNDIEKCDHGIFGAISLYKRVRTHYKTFIENENKYSYSDMNITNSNHLVLFFKAACFTIAQHNIFKSSSKKDDLLYDEYDLSYLKSERNYHIDVTTPLLAMLSIVDTIECIKYFSRTESPSNYLQVKTILKLIDLSVNESEIVLDYTKLYRYIKLSNKGELIEQYNSYKKSLKAFGAWTKYKSDFKDEILTIKS